MLAIREALPRRNMRGPLRYMAQARLRATDTPFKFRRSEPRHFPTPWIGVPVRAAGGRVKWQPSMAKGGNDDGAARSLGAQSSHLVGSGWRHPVAISTDILRFTRIESSWLTSESLQGCLLATLRTSDRGAWRCMANSLHAPWSRNDDTWGFHNGRLHLPRITRGGLTFEWPRSSAQLASTPSAPLLSPDRSVPLTRTTASLGLCSNTSSLPLRASPEDISPSRWAREGCGSSSGDGPVLPLPKNASPAGYEPLDGVSCDSGSWARTPSMVFQALTPYCAIS